jgi:hypothetical protein
MDLAKKLMALPVVLPEPAIEDWLIDSGNAKASVCRAENGKDLILSNGLVRRVFRLIPNLATVDFTNLVTGECLLRAVSPEGSLTINGKEYSLGGLEGQVEFAYTLPEWLDSMTAAGGSFQLKDFDVGPLEPRLLWAQKRWSLVKDRNLSGRMVTFTLEGPGPLQVMNVTLHIAIYDGLPLISKWFEIENRSCITWTLNSFKLEELATAERESSVDMNGTTMLPNIHIETDYAFGGDTHKHANHAIHWVTDKRYTSQVCYSLNLPCLLEVKPPLGPEEILACGSVFKSFRAWLMPFDSDDRERKGLALKRFYRTVVPWSTENPLFLHLTSSDPAVIRRAVDQCAETGYEMVIISFGSGLDMEDETEENIAKYRDLVGYANAKGIEMGCYSLLASRKIGEETDCINPETGKTGGMIFGDSPCLCSEWGFEYFRKIKVFLEKTGMTLLEHDGSYPGDLCASEIHRYHRGLADSVWKQHEKIAALYAWALEKGISLNVPDWYFFRGSTKICIGYREANWSLPRARQIILGRQNLYDGLWERMPGQTWTFVPLTQYQGGGEAATIEPLSEHLSEYTAHMMQNYGSGVQACYRGPRLYDTDETKQAVKEIVAWYKKYRDILNSDVLHLRRPDGKDWDGILHVNSGLKEKGLAMLYNPSPIPLTRTIKLPLYYTGLTETAQIREREEPAKEYRLSRDYKAEITITIPAADCTWLVVE